MADWSASQYLKFEQERTQPSRDLVQRIHVIKPGRIIDLGCGPGNSTRVLQGQFPDAEILGIDNSPDMIARAEKNCPGATFQLRSITPEMRFPGTEFDIIFANACLQWIPDHQELIPSLFAALSGRGVLAVQLPETRNMPMYQLLSDLDAASRWAPQIAGVRNFYTLELEEYYDLLAGLSTDFSIWETSYVQRVNGIDGLIEWYRGSGLRPYLAALAEAEQAEFICEVKKRLAEFYRVRPDGTVLMRFPRLFFTIAHD